MNHDLVIIRTASHDSPTIESITRDAKEALGNMRCHAEQYIENARRLGAAIKWAKETLSYGKFGPWCESELGLKASQCSVYRQLFETGEDLERAREWAQEAGRSYASTRDVKLLLRIVDEWRAETGQEQPTKRKAKSTTKTCVVKSSRAVNEQPEATEVSVSLPPHILAAAANLATAIIAHRSATGADVLDSAIDYITTAVRSDALETYAIAEHSSPENPDMHGEVHDDDAQTHESEETPLQRAIRARKLSASQHQSDGQELLPPRENSAGL